MKCNISLLLHNIVIGCFLLCYNIACSRPEKTNEILQNIPKTAITLDSTKYYFEGKIGDKLFVNAELSFTKTSVFGLYRYYNGSRALSLSGANKNDALELVEQDNLDRDGWQKDSSATVSGSVRATVNRKEGSITGTWTSKDGKRTFPFVLNAVGKFILTKDKKLDVSVDCPRFSNPQLSIMNDTLARLAKIMYQSSYSNVDTVRKDYENDPDFKDRIDMIGEHCFSNVVYASNKLVSVSYLSDSYMGGAHGIYGYEGFSWKINNGVPKRVFLKDIFRGDTDYHQQISNFLLKELKRQEASSILDGSIKSFVDDLKKETLSYTIHPAGLKFYFNPYHVGSYAEGAFEVHIPWKQVQKLVQEEVLKDIFSGQ